MFRGRLNDQLRGFYRSTYTDDDGVEHTIATTQFEATDARRAFPCWDEPDLKAVFGVTLVVPEDAAAVSNSPEIGARARRRRPARGCASRTRWSMSTYLVALSSGSSRPPSRSCRRRAAPASPTVPGKATSPPSRLEVGAFAAALVQRLLRHPLSRSGSSTWSRMPDFAHGAMENPGCITYREALLLVDPAHATQPEHERSPTSWRTSSPTCGSATSSRCGGGTASGSTRPSPPSWRARRGRAGGPTGSVGCVQPARTAAFEVDALAAPAPIEFPVDSPDDARACSTS